MANIQADATEEQRLFDLEVAKIETWWKSSKQAQITRTYTASNVAALRSSLPIAYPSSTQALKLWDILQKHRQNGTAEFTFVERAQMASPRDFFQPIVADGDMGFGTSTATMKLTKRMVEAGVAMFHLDDLALGGKSWTGGGGHTVVSTAEYLKRLAAARLQLDIMGAETMIICRCDTYDAQWITSNQDPRHQPYILGATVPLRPAASSYTTPEERSAWDKEARLMTFDDTVKASATTAQYSEYTTLLAQKTPTSLADRRRVAHQALDGQDIFFDWDLPRTADGRYRFAPTMKALIDRAVAAAAWGEVTWARMGLSIPQLREFHDGLSQVYPGRLFAGGYGATTDFSALGFSSDDVKDLHRTLAVMGIVWQVQPGFAMQGFNHVTSRFSRMWSEEGMGGGGYLRDIQHPAMAANTDTYEKMEWSGGYLADAYGEVLRVKY
ncbi:Methylisocitrate lyase [Fusarium sp. LHS14.1]|nr:Methylisocitrate lyase [Fusarium sp. LHS14.1]